MPQCFRCGKSLSTMQSLEYHLSKKTPCNALKCVLCKCTLETISEFNIHKIKCEEKRNRHLVFDKIHSTKTINIELNYNGKIEYISDNVFDLLQYTSSYLKQKHYSTLTSKNTYETLYTDIFSKCEVNACKSTYIACRTKDGQIKGFDADIKFYEDYIMISQTMIYIFSVG